jgi:hypothetical protein
VHVVQPLVARWPTGPSRALTCTSLPLMTVRDDRASCRMSEQTNHTTIRVTRTGFFVPVTCRVLAVVCSFNESEE